MTGLYIHIPFCKSRCIYCGFYSTTLLGWRQRYVDAVCKEMEIRREEGKDGIGTIYLGGGTPSQLSTEQLQQLFLYINKVYGMEHVEEVTMECNPDDITPDFAQALKQLPVNRISMGVQTFNDDRLRFLHRRHTAEQIPLAIERLRKAGISNISIDLMFGFPEQTLQEWQHDIEEAVRLDVEHMSAYSLMYEEDTLLFRLLENKQVEELDEELSLQMFTTLVDRLTAAGYEHYEISNFAKNTFRSRHNSSYWNQTPYIGLGAAAHSYNGKDCRRWNADNIVSYMEGIETGHPAFEQEMLDEDTRYNDIVMTALRTREGLNCLLLTPQQKAYCLESAQRFIDDGLLTLSEHHFRLTRKGVFVSNMVMSELMKV